MTTKTTLNKLFTLIEKFGEEHNQVRTVIFGDTWSVNNSKNENGVVLRYFPDNAQVRSTSIDYEITVEAMDECRDAEDNPKDIFDDTFKIVVDLVAYFHKLGQGIETDGQTNDFTVDLNSLQILPFNDTKESNYWGHQLTLRVSFPEQFDYCAIPT